MKIHSIFQSINGEVTSSYQGSICTFIRFQGCNLQCPYCFGVTPGKHNPKIILSNKPNKKLTDVKIGDKLLTFNDKKELVETEITNLITREVNSWLRIKIKNYEYYVTEEHPFFTTRGLKQAKDLRVGDEIYHSDFKDKLSFRMIGNKNPMKNEDVRKRSFENTDYKLIGKKISSTIKRKQTEGTYISSYDSLSKDAQKEIGEKISLSKIGDRNPNWKGGSKTPNYDKLKQQIKDGEIKICSKCLKEKPLDVHHKDNDHENDVLENLKVLCESCHYAEHEIGYNFWKNNNRKDGKQLVAMNGFKVLSIKKINRDDYPLSLKPKPLKVYNLSCEPYNSFLIDYMWVHNCDTVDSRSLNKGKNMTKKGILKAIQALPNKTKLITITGGEPLLQRGIDDLVNFLDINGYDITIETNGTICPSEEIVCMFCHVIMDCKLPSSFNNPELYEEYKEKFMKNSEELMGSSWIKFPVQNKLDFKEASSIMKALQPSNPKFAFSAVKPLTPKELLKWMFKEKISNAVLNVQIHKIIGTA